MSPGQEPAASRKVIAVGLLALAAVLIVVVQEGGEPPPLPAAPPPSPPPSTPIRNPLQLPVLPEPPARLPPPVAGVPALALPPDAAEGVVATADVAANPEALAGRLFLCTNTVAPLPVDRQAEGDRPADTSRGAGLPKVLARAHTPLARHRLTLACRLPDLRTLAVHAYFDEPMAAALPTIGSGTTVALQVLGGGPAGHVVARYVHVSERPRQTGEGDPRLPDLAAVVLRPDEVKGQTIVCEAEGLPRLLPPDQLDAEALALLGEHGKGDPEVRDSLAWQVDCAGRHGERLAALVAVPAAKADEGLRIGRGTRLAVQVRGLARQRLVVVLERVETGAVALQPGDLRQVLVRPQAHQGRVIPCQSLGLPLAVPMETPEPGLAPMEAWLVCRGPAGPPVDVLLRFRAGNQADLLAIGRGTQVELELRGRQAARLVAVLQRVGVGALPEATRAQDLRRYVVLAEGLVGDKFACRLGKAVTPADEARGPHPALRLVADLKADLRVSLSCVDDLRPTDGQRFLVVLPDENARKQSKFQAGDRVELQFAGVVDGLPVARFLRVLP